MEQASPEKIAELKAKFPDRQLFEVEGKDGEETIVQFVMTAPSRGDYKKFTDELLKAKDTKDEGERLTACRGAVERAALAQIRFPAREECQQIFEGRPAMVDGLADELHKAAGSQVEYRAKKL